MARGSATITRSTSPTIRIAVPRAPAVRGAARSMATRARKGYRKATGQQLSPIAAGMTAAVIGLAEKAGLADKLPEVPLIGRKGTLALAAYWWSRSGGGKLARDVALVSAALAGYELGREGKVSGEDFAAYSDEG